MAYHETIGSSENGGPNGRYTLESNSRSILDRSSWKIPVIDLLFKNGNGNGGSPEEHRTYLVPTVDGTFIQDSGGNWQLLTPEEAQAYTPQIEAFYEKTRIEHLGDS